VSLLKVAFTDRAWLMVTVQVLWVPLHAPAQRTNLDPLDGAAVNVTVVGGANRAVHVRPQLMPWGDDVTVPRPLPSFSTFNR
jgi:hypothetical protein